jgi:hypothetical protein
MDWRDEKAALLATIARQEQETAALARRFKLLQQTLKEQQNLLDRYQSALAVAKAAPTAQQPNKPTVDRTSNTNIATSKSNPAEVVKAPPPVEHEQQAASTWMKKKSGGSSDLETVAKPLPLAPVKKEAKEKREVKKKPTTSVFKPHAKRSSGLAATWAEEKRRIPKKPKWEQTLAAAASGAEKENVRAATDHQQTNKPKDFAYVEVVRNREERKTLPGHDCMECKKYYDALGGIGTGDAAAHKNKCSRHRARFEPYQTPDDFWRLSFPDSEPEPKSPSVI